MVKNRSLALKKELITPVKKSAVAKRDVFAGIAMAAFTMEQQSILMEPVRDDHLEIKATGEVYLAHVYYRDRLNRAFGIGAWAIRPIQHGWHVQDDVMYREYALYVNGRYVSAAMGEAEYIPSNKRMTYGSTAEALRSNALVRCCKDIGVALECWSRKFTNDWREKHCVAVIANTRNGMRLHWRKKDAGPMKGELRLASDAEAAAGRVIYSPEEKKKQQEQKPATASNGVESVDKGSYQKFLEEMKRCRDILGAEEYSNILGRFSYEQTNMVPKDRMKMMEVYKAMIAKAEDLNKKI